MNSLKKLKLQLLDGISSINSSDEINLDQFYIARNPFSSDSNLDFLGLSVQNDNILIESEFDVSFHVYDGLGDTEPRASAVVSTNYPMTFCDMDTGTVDINGITDGMRDEKEVQVLRHVYDTIYHLRALGENPRLVMSISGKSSDNNEAFTYISEDINAEDFMKSFKISEDKKRIKNTVSSWVKNALVFGGVIASVHYNFMDMGTTFQHLEPIWNSTVVELAKYVGVVVDLLTTDMGPMKDIGLGLADVITSAAANISKSPEVLLGFLIGGITISSCKEMSKNGELVEDNIKKIDDLFSTPLKNKHVFDNDPMEISRTNSLAM